MIDVVMPSMWVVDGIIANLEKYVANPLIKKIYIINNNPSKKPSADILAHEKIEMISYGANIYVNPAWNEGYLRSTTDVVAFINDDIYVEQDVFQMVLDFKLDPGEMRSEEHTSELQSH